MTELWQIDDIQALEVAWYRQHGKHPDRIRSDVSGKEYVIGDFSWNRNYIWDESIENNMHCDIEKAKARAK